MGGPCTPSADVSVLVWEEEEGMHDLKQNSCAGKVQLVLHWAAL